MKTSNLLLDELYVFLEERNWHKPSPGSLAKSISIESAELLEHFQWAEPSSDDLKSDNTKLSKIQSELADVLIYCYEMAISLDLNPDTIVRDKLKKARLKYPAQEIKDNPEIYESIRDYNRLNGTN
ncbi:MAG: nucleotide pyrophosphohydrolase [Patescibacteria group bacterium]